MRLLIAAVALSLAACGVSNPADSVSRATAGPTSGDGTAILVEKACAGTSYSRCVASLTLAVSAFPGSVVAICEYGAGEGDVVTVDENETAEAACSSNGLIVPSAVHTTVKIPGD
jgi:hypothetical protein